MRIERGGVSVDVREAGTGPTLLLVHGYPLDGGMWSGVARILAERFRVVKPDFPGRPENPLSGDGTMQGYADFLGALVDAASKPVGIAAFSMGGYAALALLRGRPDAAAALALVDTRATADDENGRAKREEAIAAIREKGSTAAADAMVEKLLSPEARRRSDVVERVRRMILRQDPNALVSDLAAMRDRADQTGLLGELRIPTLVLAGELDEVTPPAAAREMAAAIPGAEFLQIPGAGHLSPVEKPKAIAAALGAFFERTLLR